MKFQKKLKAFTLVELIIVIAIIAILIMVAIPQYNKAKKSAIVSTHNSNYQAVKAASIMAEVNDNDVNKFEQYLEGNKAPEVPDEIPGGPGTFSVSSVDGEVVVSPGLMEFKDGTIQAKSSSN